MFCLPAADVPANYFVLSLFAGTSPLAIAAAYHGVNGIHIDLSTYQINEAMKHLKSAPELTAKRTREKELRALKSKSGKSTAKQAPAQEEEEEEENDENIEHPQGGNDSQATTLSALQKCIVCSKEMDANAADSFICSNRTCGGLVCSGCVKHDDFGKPICKNCNKQ